MPYVVQSSLAGGEISPELHGRTDSAKYAVSLARARNVFVRTYGGVDNRPGTLLVAPTASKLFVDSFPTAEGDTPDNVFARIERVGDIDYMRVFWSPVTDAATYALETQYYSDASGLWIPDPGLSTTTLTEPLYTGREGNTGWIPGRRYRFRAAAIVSDVQGPWSTWALRIFEATEAVVPTLPDATAPTATVVDLDNVNELSITPLTLTISGGIYDLLRYEWEIVTGNGTLSQTDEATALYTAPSVTVDETVTVRCTVTSVGLGVNALLMTEASVVTADEVFTIKNLATDLPDAEAPHVTVDELDAIAEGQAVALTLTLTGGTYDSLSYAWTIDSESYGTGSLSNANTASAVYTSGAIDDDSAVTISCVVTASGTGDTAASGTTDSNTDLENFIVTKQVDPAPVLVTPSAPSGVPVTSSSIRWITDNSDSNADGYRLEYEDIETEDTTVIDIVFSGSITVTGLRPSSDYRARVRSYHNAPVAVSEWSEWSSTVTTLNRVIVAPPALPDAVAPTGTINGPDTFMEQVVTPLSISTAGGVYDSISYLWSILSGTGTLSNETTATPSYVSGDITEDMTLSIGCTVSVTGQGSNARAGTSDSRLVSYVFTVHPDIQAVVSDKSIGAGEVATMSANLVGNDLPSGSRTYLWTQTEGTTAEVANTTSRTITILAPHSYTAETLTFQCVITAGGVDYSTTAELSVGARPAVKSQAGKGPTADDSIPARSDGYLICGVSDPSRYSLWNSRPGRVFTYSNATGNFPSDTFRQPLITGPLSQEHYLWQKSAIYTWQDIGDFTFLEVADSASNDLRFGYQALSPGFIGIANGSLNPETAGVYIGYSPTLFDTYNDRTPEHEVGHFLGVWHPDQEGGGKVTNTIMETLGSLGGTVVDDPRLGDRWGIYHLYGPSANARVDAPDACRSLSTTDGIGSIALTWSAPTLNGGASITGYRITARNLSSGANPVVKNSTTTSYTHTGLTAGDIWSYRVQAINSQGAGLPSDDVRGAVQNSEGGYPDPESVTFEWTDSDILIVSGDDPIIGIAEPSSRLPLSWIQDYEDAYIGRTLIRANTGTVILLLNDVPTSFSDLGLGAGPDFVDEVRENLTITVTSGSDELVLDGIPDENEPYLWIPSNVDEVTAWANNRSAGDPVTIALTYNSEGGDVPVVPGILGNATAPTLTLSDPDSVDEGTSVDIVSTVMSGQYDTITYLWTVVTGGGTLTNTSSSTATYAAPSVASGTSVTVRCTVIVAGTGTNAANGTSATVTTNRTFSVADTDNDDDLPNAVAPTVTIDAVSSVTVGNTVTLGLTVSGGTYDTLSYNWIEYGDQGTITNATTATPTYTPAATDSSVSEFVYVTVTARGTGVNAASGTSATANDNELFTINPSLATPPDAVAPTIAINEVSSVTVGNTVTLGATISGGTYDTLTYNWIEYGDQGMITNFNSATPIYTPADTDSTIADIVYLVVTARGTGTNAANGTLATAKDTEVLTINPRPATPPDAVAPTVTINAVSSVTVGNTLTLGLTVSGGTYDTLTYNWIEYGDQGMITNPNSATPIYTPAATDSTIADIVYVVVTARGTGTNAASGTSDTANDTETFTIYPDSADQVDNTSDKVGNTPPQADITSPQSDTIPEGEASGAQEATPELQQEPTAREILPPSPDVRLIPFEFSNDDTYTLEFSDRAMRVIRNRELVRDKTLTGVTVTASATPVFTSTAHGLADNDEVFLLGFRQMTELNGRWCVVNSVTTDTFQLTESSTGEALDTSSYVAETTGGVVDRIYKTLSPYIAEDLPSVKYVQDADVMTLTSPYYLAYELRRTGHSDWAFVPVTYTELVSGPSNAISDNTGVNASSPTVNRYQVTSVDGSTGQESLPGTTEWLKVENCSIEEGDVRTVTYTGATSFTATGTGSISGNSLTVVDFEDTVLPRLWFYDEMGNTDKKPATRPQTITRFTLNSSSNIATLHLSLADGSNQTEGRNRLLENPRLGMDITVTTNVRETDYSFTLTGILDATESYYWTVPSAQRTDVTTWFTAVSTALASDTPVTIEMSYDPGDDIGEQRPPFEPGQIIEASGFTIREDLNGTQAQVLSVNHESDPPSFTITSLQNEEDTELGDDDGGTGVFKLAEIPNYGLSDDSAVNLMWRETEGASYIVYKRTVSGNFSFLAAVNGTEYEDEGDIIPDESKMPPATQRSVSVAQPAACGYFQQRRIFGGGNRTPARWVASRVGDHSDFVFGTLADSAISAQLAAQKVNSIEHIVPGRTMLMLTSDTEWLVSSAGDSAFSATTLRQVPQAAVGASPVRPLSYDGQVIFERRNGGSLLSTQYSFESDSYGISEVSLFARHLFAGKHIEDMVQVNTPDNLVLACMDDGLVNVLSFYPEQEVIAWAAWDTQGIFESVAAIPNAQEGTDDTYFVVRRNIQDSQGRTYSATFIEMLHSRRFTNEQDAFFVDSGITYRGEATSRVPGLFHLRGQTVSAVADGTAVLDVPVDLEGVAQLPFGAQHVQIGLPYVSRVQTLDLFPGPKKRIPLMFLRTYRSLGLAAGPDQDNVNEFRSEGNELVTGDLPLAIQSSWRDTLSILIRQQYPLPMSLLSIVVDAEGVDSQ